MFDSGVVLVVGMGGHSRAVVDVLETLGWPSKSEIIAPAGLQEFVAQYRRIVIGVGHIKDPQPRIDLFFAASALGFEISRVISPRSWLARTAVLGEGSQVMHGVGVNAGAQIGCNCILNTNSLIEHDCVIGDHCHISTGAIVNGGVKIGRGTFIGSGALIKEGVTIGEYKVIGMGEIVRRDIP